MLNSVYLFCWCSFLFDCPICFNKSLSISFSFIGAHLYIADELYINKFSFGGDLAHL